MIYWDNQGVPICGHYFWDNEYGATLFCKKLWFLSVKVYGGAKDFWGYSQKYLNDSFRIGRCINGDEWKICSGGCNDYQLGGKCNGIDGYCGQSTTAKIYIDCEGGTHIKLSSCKSKVACYWQALLLRT